MWLKAGDTGGVHRSLLPIHLTNRRFSNGRVQNAICVYSLNITACDDWVEFWWIYVEQVIYRYLDCSDLLGVFARSKK